MTIITHWFWVKYMFTAFLNTSSPTQLCSIFNTAAPLSYDFLSNIEPIFSRELNDMDNGCLSVRSYSKATWCFSTTKKWSNCQFGSNCKSGHLSNCQLVLSRVTTIDRPYRCRDKIFKVSGKPEIHPRKVPRNGSHQVTKPLTSNRTAGSRFYGNFSFGFYVFVDEK